MKTAPWRKRHRKENATLAGEVEKFVDSAMGKQAGMLNEGAKLADGMKRMLTVQSRTCPRIAHAPKAVGSPDGAHLPIAVADKHQHVFGGHAGFRSIVRTTVEAVLVFLPAWRLTRERDTATGYDALVVRPHAANED